MSKHLNLCERILYKDKIDLENFTSNIIINLTQSVDTVEILSFLVVLYHCRNKNNASVKHLKLCRQKMKIEPLLYQIYFRVNSDSGQG